MSRTDRRRRHGMVLLEVIVALTILAVGAIAMVTLGSASLHAVARADAADRDMRRANALFEAVALWPRTDLDRHLGDRPEGPWLLRVDRPLPTLYVVTLADTASGHLVLETSLYRAEVTDAAP
ncbi:MAG TPA: prepilin-type N-terminal cleavage/methylation domain-containing protein [Gemmatimonadaceae bacterium]|jgi:prepilin-type N-terminal cleavage/methylation domain-containing protein